jgi:hypothetical protein
VPGPAAAPGVAPAQLAAVPAPAAAPPAPDATPPATRPAQSPALLPGVTPMQLAAAAMADDPVKAFAALTNQTLRLEKFEDPKTGQTHVWAVDKDGAKVADRGIFPTDKKTVNVVEGGQLVMHELLPNMTVGKAITTVPYDGTIAKVWDPATKTELVKTRRPDGSWADVGQAKPETTTVNVRDGDKMVMRVRNSDGSLQPGNIGEVPHEVQKQIEFDPASGQYFNTERGLDGKWTRTTLAPPPPELTVRSTGRAAQDVAIAAGSAGQSEQERNAAKDQQTLYESRGTAIGLNDRLNMYGALLDGVKTGRLAPWMANVGAISNAMGLNLESIAPGLGPQAAVNAQVLQKVGNELVLGQLGGQGMPRNNFSDRDLAFLKDTMPQLQNMPEANRVIVAYLKGMQQRALDHVSAWDDYSKAHGDATDAKTFRAFERQWGDQIASDPVVHRLPGKAEISKVPPGRIYTYFDERGQHFGIRGGSITGQ